MRLIRLVLLFFAWQLYAQMPYYFAPDYVAREHKLYYPDRLPYPEIPRWGDFSSLTKAFEFVRDYQYVGGRPIDWSFIADGCFARAELMVSLMETQFLQQDAPLKVFAFGKLEHDWAYHVAPLVIYQNSFFVIDPAVHFEAPIALEDWALLIGLNPDNFNIAICRPHTYELSSNCYEPKVLASEKVIADYLRSIGE